MVAGNDRRAQALKADDIAQASDCQRYTRNHEEGTSGDINPRARGQKLTAHGLCGNYESDNDEHYVARKAHRQNQRDRYAYRWTRRQKWRNQRLEE